MKDKLAEVSTPIKEIADFQPLIERIKDKKVVMLGESSHGTQEFYEWRRLLSNELVRNHGFNAIAVEGDWPPCQKINQYIQGKTSEDAHTIMDDFSRWPTWMWGNTEALALVDDLKEMNQQSNKPIGFHGLDVYSLYESIDEVIKKLNTIDPDLANKAKDLYSCFDPFKNDERDYVRSLFSFPMGCEQEVAKVLEDVLKKKLEDDSPYFDIVQNARIIQNAEKYYRSMISQEDQSWNVRDQHMMDTLENLLDHYGPDAKIIVWAHNTHIGDYRATSMLAHGQINLGGLARKKYGSEDVALIGFTTFNGEVIASTEWDGPIEIMTVPKARISSFEYVLHQLIPIVGHEDFYLDFNSLTDHDFLNDYIGHRAIGVVFHPEREISNYVLTVPAKRYDFMVFLNKTGPLVPILARFDRHKIPETYPFGDRL